VISEGAIMSVKLKWFYGLLQNDTISEAGKLRAARLLHLIEFPDDENGGDNESCCADTKPGDTFEAKQAPVEGG
jgi:hypothetical protein